MDTVNVEFGPPPASYDSFETAVAAAVESPLFQEAKADGGLLVGSEVESVIFGDSACAILLSNDMHLLAEARDFQVVWKIAEGTPRPIEPVPARKFCSPELSDWVFDPAQISSVILNAEIVELGYTFNSLLVYTRGNEILWLSAYKEQHGGDLLHAHFES